MKIIEQSTQKMIYQCGAEDCGMNEQSQCLYYRCNGGTIADFTLRNFDHNATHESSLQYKTQSLDVKTQSLGSKGQSLVFKTQSLDTKAQSLESRGQSLGTKEQSQSNLRNTVPSCV